MASIDLGAPFRNLCMPPPYNAHPTHPCVWFLVIMHTHLTAMPVLPTHMRPLRSVRTPLQQVCASFPSLCAHTCRCASPPLRPCTPSPSPCVPCMHLYMPSSQRCSACVYQHAHLLLFNSHPLGYWQNKVYKREGSLISLLHHPWLYVLGLSCGLLV